MKNISKNESLCQNQQTLKKVKKDSIENDLKSSQESEEESLPDITMRNELEKFKQEEETEVYNSEQNQTQLNNIFARLSNKNKPLVLTPQSLITTKYQLKRSKNEKQVKQTCKFCAKMVVESGTPNNAMCNECMIVDDINNKNSIINDNNNQNHFNKNNESEQLQLQLQPNKQSKKYNEAQLISNKNSYADNIPQYKLTPLAEQQSETAKRILGVCCQACKVDMQEWQALVDRVEELWNRSRLFSRHLYEQIKKGQCEYIASKHGQQSKAKWLQNKKRDKFKPPFMIKTLSFVVFADYVKKHPKLAQIYSQRTYCREEKVTELMFVSCQHFIQVNLAVLSGDENEENQLQSEHLQSCIAEFVGLLRSKMAKMQDTEMVHNPALSLQDIHRSYPRFKGKQRILASHPSAQQVNTVIKDDPPNELRKDETFLQTLQDQLVLHCYRLVGVPSIDYVKQGKSRNNYFNALFFLVAKHILNHDLSGRSNQYDLKLIKRMYVIIAEQMEAALEAFLDAFVANQALKSFQLSHTQLFNNNTQIIKQDSGQRQEDDQEIAEECEGDAQTQTQTLTLKNALQQQQQNQNVNCILKDLENQMLQLCKLRIKLATVLNIKKVKYAIIFCQKIQSAQDIITKYQQRIAQAESQVCQMESNQ